MQNPCSSSYRIGAIALALALALASAATMSSAMAASHYDESVNGDLSNDGLNPTSLTFSSGANQVIGTTGRTGSVIDRDYFAFTIAAGQRLTAIDVLAGTSALGVFSFIGIESGSQVTVSTAATTAAGLLGWWHYSGTDVGTDILGPMSISNNGSSGFSAPLGAGTYAMWVQDFGAGTVNYAFQFDVSAVPEPGSWALLGFGLAALIPMARSRLATRSSRSRALE